jgi:hypothetical protein
MKATQGKGYVTAIAVGVIPARMRRAPRIPMAWPGHDPSISHLLHPFPLLTVTFRPAPVDMGCWPNPGGLPGTFCQTFEDRRSGGNDFNAPNYRAFLGTNRAVTTHPVDCV